MKRVNLLRQLSRTLNITLLTVASVTVLLPLSITPPAKASLFEDWKRILISSGARGGGPWGGRTGDVCFIAPLPESTARDDVALIWNDRPTFTWQNSLEWLELRSADGTQLVRRFDFSQAESSELVNQITLAGSGELVNQIRLETALQPGQTYSLTAKVPFVRAFQPVLLRVMAAPERDKVASDLEVLAAQGGTAEEIAVRQVNYFAERRLWADFWQTALAVEQPSAELRSVLEGDRKSVCE